MRDFQYRHFPIFNRGRLHSTGLKHLGSLLRVVKVLCKVDRILSDSSLMIGKTIRSIVHDPILK